MGAQATSFWDKLYKQLPLPVGGRLFSSNYFFPRSSTHYLLALPTISSGGSWAHFLGLLLIIRYTGLSFSTHTAKNVVSVLPLIA